MQPTENKQPTQEELIAHVRKSLKSHEEPYSLGAWENFNATQQFKRTPIFWMTRLGGVAAVIALCFSIFLLTKNNDKNSTHGLVKIKQDKVEEQSLQAMKNNSPEKEALEQNNEGIENQMNHLTDKLSKLLIIKSSSLAVMDSEMVAINEAVKSNAQQVDQSTNQSQIKVEAPLNSGEKTGFINEVKSNSIAENIQTKETLITSSTSEKFKINNNKRKWVLSLMVAPSFGNSEELNMGYGLNMALNISKKLALITGISYNEMSASKDFTNNIGMSSILYGNNKSLAAISQKVTGLDIPLELKYSFNKNVYASVGVSAFAVIGQSRNNTFIQGVVVNGIGNKSTSSTGASGDANSSDLSGSKGQFANTYILNKKIVERANLEDQNSVNYLGFYNISFGYKKKMLKKHSVAFEPFVKLPIREVTQDNLRLMGAGLRLKVDF